MIPDAENYLLINVLNCLSKVENVLIYTMTSNKIGANYSRYITNCSVYPKTDDPRIRIENINSVVLKYNIDIIMPIHDSGVADLISYKEYIKNQQKIVLLPSREAHKIASNKGMLGLHLKSYGIPAPLTWVLRKENFLAYREFDLNFPFIIKPSTKSHGGLGVALVYTETELQNYLTTYKDFEDYVVQEYFEGEDWGCSVLCKNGSIRAYSLQRTILHEKNVFAPAIGIELVHDKKPLVLIEKLLKSLAWQGVAHIDMRYNPNTDQFVIIEMNARYWASIEASSLGGINFPYLHAKLSLGEDLALPSYSTIKYLKLKGVFSKILNDVFFLFNFRFLKSNTELGSVFKDPIPTVFRTLAKIKRRF